MNVYVRVIILRMLNLMNRIKLPLAAVLFTCVVLLSTAAAFASEGESPSPSEVSNWLAPDLDDVLAKSVAEEIYDKLSEGTRADATITDVYNILRYDILPGLKGSVSNSTYSLPRIAYDTRRGLFGTGTMETISAWDLLYRLAPLNNLGTNQFPLVYSPAGSSFTYTLAELAGMSWSHLGDIVSNTASSLTYLSQINSKLSNTFTWSSLSSTFAGSYFDSTLTSSVNSFSQNTSYYVGFNSINPYYSNTTPSLLRLFVPIRSSNNSLNYSDFSIRLYYLRNNSLSLYDDVPDYFVEPTPTGSYIYFFDFRPIWASYYFGFFSSSGSMNYDPAYTPSLSYISFDTDAYQQIKQAFYQAKAANSFGSIENDVNRLANYLADPNKIAAENASQAVIDDTLDGFTGNGSAAAKTSDTGAMKNMSGSIQSGLDTGAGVSNATSVFDLSSGFWGWFSQENSNYINNPYPAPDVPQLRFSGDEIIDFVSGNDSAVEDLLRGAEW